MNKYFQLKIYPYFFAAFPLLSLYDFNKDISQFSYLAMPLLITLLGTFALLNITKLFLRGVFAANIFVSFFVLTFLSFGHFFEFTNDFLSDHFTTFAHQAYSYYLTYYSGLLLWLGSNSFLVYLLSKNSQKLRKINTIAASVSLILFFIPLADIAIYQLNSGVQDKRGAQFEHKSQPNRSNPDIYYIILDGYGRHDVLKDYYGIENGRFIEELENKNFYIAKQSRSNYPQTYLSLASSLNYDYLDSLIPDLDKKSDDRWILRSLIRNNSAYDFLAQQGYAFATLPSIWSGTKNNLYSDYAFGAQLSSNEFNQLVIKLTPIGASFGQKIRFDQQRKITNYSFGKLPQIANIKGPTFTYVHFLIPHPPFIFDANGEPINNRGKQMDFHGMHKLNDEENLKKYREGYVAQLQFASKKILGAIDQLIANSPTPPVIILQSDHGPGSMLDWENEGKTNLHERMSILNAYYLPDKGKEMLYDSITPVNSFRVVFNALFDAELELLEDRSYFARWSTPYDFIDVTEQVKQFEK